MKRIATVFFGLVVIAVVTPLAQLCTISVTNHDLETSSVSGWAYGGLFVMVMMAMVWRLLRRRKQGSREQLVLLFTMFAMAVPVMNLGLARQLYTNLFSIPHHFVGYGVDGYARAYRMQEPAWFPVVPVTEDLARLKSEKILSFLQDDPVAEQQRAETNALWLQLQSISRRLGRDQAVTEDAVEEVNTAVKKLSVMSAERISGRVQREAQLKTWMQDQGLEDVLQAQIQKGLRLSTQAREDLSEVLPELDETWMHLNAQIQDEKLDRGARQRVAQWEEGFSPEQREEMHTKAAGLSEPQLRKLQSQVQRLHAMDLETLISARSAQYLSSWSSLSDAELSSLRNAFIFRLGKQERKALMSRDGRDLMALYDGIYQDSREQARLAEQGFLTNTTQTMGRVPWEIWKGPLLRWGSLFLTVAGLMVYLACLLRKRWVERENLAFPLVEVADHLIRHDYCMESADDLCAPEPRERAFATLFWAGFALGLLMILVDGSAFLAEGKGAPLATDLSKTLFTTGALNSLRGMIFVLSPIMLGLFFLLNLEMSFSVWACYLIYRINFWALGQGTPVKDPNYVGFTAQGFPFHLEQLLGAGLCFALVLILKALVEAGRQQRVRRTSGESRGLRGPVLLQVAGLAGFLLMIYLLCADLGLRSPLLFTVFIGVGVLLAIAVARMRAETGFPLYHTTYDFTRLPIVLGLTPHVDLRSMLSFFSLAFLPVTMLFRLLPQQIENFELGRRHRMPAGLFVVSGMLAVLTAMAVGLISLLVMSYWLGDVALGQGAVSKEPGSFALANYSSWVSHFRGENGIESFTVVHKVRMMFVGVGAAVFGLLMICRQRFLKFPLHPMGYLLLLFSIYYAYISPFVKGGAGIKLSGVSWLWGSAFTAWLLKKLVMKYGGIQAYRRLKPAAVGLIFGAAFTLLAINMVDLIFSHGEPGEGASSSSGSSFFRDKPAYSPEVY